MGEKIFELLAPAGSLEILKTVIDAGADAVYAGGDMFGARAYANNFSKEEMLEALDYAHLRGRKIYMTVNTLIKNKELEHLYDFLLPYYEHGLDAVLVQDLGALTYIHKCFPDMELHTSTQMTITGVDGIRALADCGVHRVVMPRELSLAEMKLIHEETGMELEAFVHGALCYSYSGQCLFSSLLGGRSGNRGRCAQPCRLAYTVLDEQHKKRLDKSYVLSMKDMCGIHNLPELHKAGVYSLKIEGRMKQLSYAAGVTSMYRKAIDSYEQSLQNQETYSLSQADEKRIWALGNRCGFTDRYYFQQNDKSMITFEKPNFSQSQEETLSFEAKKVPLFGKASFLLGQPAELTVTSADGISVTVHAGVTEGAKKVPSTAEEIAERLKKTGATSFYFKELSVVLSEEEVFVPNGVVNQLRRAAIEELQEKLLKDSRRETPSHLEVSKKMAKTRQDAPKTYSASVETREQLSVLLSVPEISRIYLDISMYGKKDLCSKLEQDIVLLHEQNKEAYLALPHIFRKRAKDFCETMQEQLTKLPLDGFLVRNLEELEWVRTNWTNPVIRADHHLYTYNSLAKQFLMDKGVVRDTMPLELNQKEIRNRWNEGTEMIVYGHYPLMLSAQCVHKNTVGCDQTSGKMELKDRYQTTFAVRNYCTYCYNILYNSVATQLFSYEDELSAAGIREFRLLFTIESQKEVQKVVDLLLHKKNKDKAETAFTNGHYKRGVE